MTTLAHQAIETPFTVTVASTGAGVFTFRVCASGPHSARAERDRTAAAYRVAAELERLAGVEDRTYAVDASCARDGVVRARLTGTVEGGDLEIMFEISCDAVSYAGFTPTPPEDNEKADQPAPVNS